MVNCAACKHSYELNSWDEGYKEEDDFIRLGLTNEIKVISSGDLWRDPLTHQLHACPKCGTVKIQV